MDNRSTNLILFGVIAVVVVAYGLVIPLFPTIIESLGGSGRDLGLTMAAFAVMQFLFSPFWGNLSDAIGRKPVILIGLVGTTFSLALYGLCTQLWMFYGVRVFAGAFASATFPTATAYIGDTTSEQDRGSGMGLVSGAMYAGMMVGPAMSGWLAEISLSFPFYAGAALCGLLLASVLAMLPESLPADMRSGASGRELLRGPDLGEMRGALRGPTGYLFFLSFLLSFGIMCFWSIFGMYALEAHGFGPGPVGTIMACIGGGSTVVQVFLTGPLARRWGEGRLIRLSLAASSLGFLAMLAAVDFISLLLATCLLVMANSLIRPLVTTLISKSATEGQGKAMGLNNAFMSLGQIIGPTWAGYALDLNLALPFLSGAMVMAFGWVTTYVGFSTPRPRAIGH